MGEIVTLLGQVAETTSECAWLSPIADAAARNWFWTMVAGVFVVGIVASMLTNIVTSINRERSRREIAAYIAEGSMTPEQGERLMAARVKDADNA